MKLVIKQMIKSRLDRDFFLQRKSTAHAVFFQMRFLGVKEKFKMNFQLSLLYYPHI